MKTNEMEGAVEAVLFASGSPVETKKLALALDCEEAAVAPILEAMNARYQAADSGFFIKKIEDGFQLCTNPRYTEQIRKSLKLEKKQPLSQTLLETLAIIAYMQPVTRAQIAEIRGTDAQHSVNKLMEKGLVCERGRLDAPGKPILFGTTDEFLRRFGFSSINEIPAAMQELEAAIQAPQTDTDGLPASPDAAEEPPL